VINPEVQEAIRFFQQGLLPEDDRLEEFKQQYEAALSELDAHFLGALMSGDWAEFDQFVSDFKNQ
jgi:hypothetical protein